MFTLLIIIVCIIAVIASAKKDKHNVQEDAETMASLPSFNVYAKPMNTLSKVVNMALDKSHLLKSFSYNNGSITVALEDGKTLSAPLSSLFVVFENVRGTITYKITGAGKKMTFV